MSMHQNIAITSSSLSTLVAPMQPLRHPASLLPSSCHDPSLLSIFAKPVSPELVKWVAQMFTAYIIVDENFPESMLPTPPATPEKPMVNHANTAALPPLEEFITPLVESSRAHAATLLSTLIYLERLCTALPNRKGIPSCRHRIFLATFIIAAKYLNDCSPKNCNWADFAPWFPISEINEMELELLRLLDYRLRFTEQETCRHLALFTSSLTVAQRLSIFDRSVQTAPQCAGKDVLTPSPSANELPHLTTRTFPFPRECTPLVHKRTPNKSSMPLSSLMAAKNPCQISHPQQDREIFSLPTPKAMSLVVYSDSNRSGNLNVPQINVERSRGFSNLESMNEMDLLLAFPSEPSLTTSGFHISNPPGFEVLHQPSIAHLSDSESLPRLPLYLSNRHSMSEFNHTHPGEGDTTIRPSIIKNSLDGFFRRFWGRHRADSPGSISIGRPPRLRQYGVFHEEIPYHISRPPLREFLRSVANPDPVYESMVVC